MKLRRAGVQRLAILLRIVGMALGILVCIAYFDSNKKEIERYDLVRGQVAAGIIVQHNDGGYWWKDRGGEQHPYIYEIPTRRPDPSDAYWSLLMPVVGFIAPWGAVMIIAWLVTGFTGRPLD